MLCYRGQTFCQSNCANEQCDSRLTDAVRAEARKWWGKDGEPIAVADFAPTCPDYRRK